MSIISKPVKQLLQNLSQHTETEMFDKERKQWKLDKERKPTMKSTNTEVSYVPLHPVGANLLWSFDPL